jgi:hypothetical protein
MSAVRFLIVTMCMSALAVISFAQQGALSPVPIWPANGVIPPELQGKYVFYDPSTEELVLVFPENLETLQPGGTAGRLHIERVGTNRGARPSITFSVLPTQKKYLYSYRIENDARAKKFITAIDIPAPSFGNDDILTAPAHWRASPMKSQVSAVGDALRTFDAGYLLSFYFDDDKGPIQPGSGGNFSILASARPGFTVAWVRGGLFPSFSTELPPAVTDQLAPALAMNFNTTGVVAIGPKFAGDEPPIRIASDFHFGITQLINNGQLNGSSPAIREAMAALANFIEQPDSVQIPLTLRENASAGLESAVLQALMLSLN